MDEENASAGEIAKPGLDTRIEGGEGGSMRVERVEQGPGLGEP